jgi:AraC family transcriptional regulator
MKQQVRIPESKTIQSGLVLSSEPLGWEHVSLSKWQGVAPQEAYEPALSRHLIVIHTTPGPVKVFERGEGIQGEGIARPGDINLFSAGETSYCRWEDKLSFLRLEVSSSFVKEVALRSDIALSGNIELNHQLRINDPKLFHLSQWLLDEIQSSGAGGKLYLDSLADLMAVHILRNYTSDAKPKPLNDSPGKLSDQQVVRAIEYMHANLERDISLEELTAAVNVSRSHLGRMFKQSTGFSPHQYLINMKVDKAKTIMKSGSCTLGEIAAALGFTDQSHMNRHFKRITGLSPREFILNHK